MSNIKEVEEKSKSDAAETSHIDDMGLEINLKDITPANGLTTDDLFLILLCGCDIEKVKQNDWRKMNGIAMKRRKHEH